MIFRQILFIFLDPNSECFSKYDAFCSHIFDYACLKRKAYCYRRGSKIEIMEKLHISKTFFKMAGGRMHTPHSDSTPWIRPWPLSYKNHQRSLTYFSEVSTFTNVDLAAV